MQPKLNAPNLNGYQTTGSRRRPIQVACQLQVLSPLLSELNASHCFQAAGSKVSQSWLMFRPAGYFLPDLLCAR